MLSAIAPHIFGAIGLGLIVAAWQYNARTLILRLNALAFLAFAVELSLLSAYVGAVIMVTAAAQAVFAVATRKAWVAALITVPPVLLSALLYRHWYDLLPMIAHVTAAFTFFSQDVLRMRTLAPVGTLLWAVHNAVVGAWAQLIADFFILFGMLAGYLRNR